MRWLRTDPHEGPSSCCHELPDWGLGSVVELDIEAFDATMQIVRQPAEYPVEHALDMDDEERDALARLVWEPHAEEFARIIGSDSPSRTNEAWLLFCKAC